MLQSSKVPSSTSSQKSFLSYCNEEIIIIMTIVMTGSLEWSINKDNKNEEIVMILASLHHGYAYSHLLISHTMIILDLLLT